MPDFAERAKPLVATLAQIAKHQKAEAEYRVLSQASPTLVKTGYDNWDGGTDLYSLLLKVPVELYAEIQPNQDVVEKGILQRLHPLIRTEYGNSVNEVVISPPVGEELPGPHSLAPTEDASPLPSFWLPGNFRLFVSHTSSMREKAHGLKASLSQLQIAAFVAHDDIEPTKEWQSEIETALRTMDALIAFVSPNFYESKWCDQEVGIAIGRGKLVIPLRLGADPHGFLGKYQGLTPASSTTHSVVAEKVRDILLGHELTQQRMAEALLDRLASANSWEQAKRTMDLLDRVESLTPNQVTRLRIIPEENDEVKDAFGVPARIESLIRRVT